MELAKSFVRAKNVSTPLIAITTLDQSATINLLRPLIKSGIPQIQWDCVAGIDGLNKEGKELIGKLLGGEDQMPLDATSDPVLALTLAREFRPDTVMFLMNAQDHLAEARVRQAIWNLRDLYKRNGQTLVLLGPDFSFPPSLAQDIVVLDAPLPDDTALRATVLEQYKSAGLEAPEEGFLKKCVEAIRGLAEFPAEQVVANSITKQGVDLENLWNHKKNVVEQTAGLVFNNSKETFDEIGGLTYFKTFMTRLFKGGAPPNAVIFIDEIEKLFAGAVHGTGDNTGVSQDQLGVLLSWMEDNRATGLLCVGVAGSGKSHGAKAAANTFEVPCVKLDLGGAKAGIVGQSESRIREAMKVIKSIAGSNAFFIATCNKLESLPPELVRRFTQGIMFFDIPTEEEKAPIWTICLKQYNLKVQQDRPDDSNWTGAEIRNCCDLAFRWGCSVVEAAKHIRPIYNTHRSVIERLRAAANNCWNCASYEGEYKIPGANVQTGPRKIRIEDEFLEEKI